MAADLNPDRHELMGSQAPKAYYLLRASMHFLVFLLKYL
jgi:hypothetical protein